MTPEEAYQEALRRIREAERTGALELDLSYFSLNRLTPELARLTSLQSLNLSYCLQLGDNLSPLASLSSLQSLNLALLSAQRLIPAGRSHFAQCTSTIWLLLGRFVGKHRSAL